MPGINITIPMTLYIQTTDAHKYSCKNGFTALIMNYRIIQYSCPSKHHQHETKNNDNYY